MWLWPIWKFWLFTPYGWLLAIVWNMFEIFQIQCWQDATPKWFGLIVGCKGKKL